MQAAGTIPIFWYLSFPLNEPVLAIKIANLEGTVKQVESLDRMAKGYNQLTWKTCFSGMEVVEYEIVKEYLVEQFHRLKI